MVYNDGRLIYMLSLKDVFVEWDNSLTGYNQR